MDNKGKTDNSQASSGVAGVTDQTPPPSPFPVTDSGTSKDEFVKNEKSQTGDGPQSQQEPVQQSVGDTPDDDFSALITDPQDKSGSRVGKKVVATILAILFLVTAVATGVYLVQSQQIIRTQAWDCSRYVFGVSQDGIVTIQNGSTRYEPLQQAKVFINGQLVDTLDVPALNAGDAATLGVVAVPETGAFTWEVVGTKDCDDSGSHEVTATPTPTAVPITALCKNIQATDSDGNPLAIEGLTSLSAGEVVRFIVTGETSEGNYDQAKFLINSETFKATKLAETGAITQFYIDYTIPEGVTSFSVNAQLHHTKLGWF